jgi:hypothetical protein
MMKKRGKVKRKSFKIKKGQEREEQELQQQL